jgi:hypothetical protein
MNRTSPNHIPLERARLKLARLWLVGAGLIILILVAQSIFGKYGSEVPDVWEWALPTIMPTLSLIVAVLGIGALESKSAKASVRKTFLEISVTLSGGYLALILITILAEPLTNSEPLSLYKLSSLWLAPIQGLVTASIGIVFFTKTENAPRER